VLGDEPYATGAQFISLDGQSLLTGTGPFGPETDYLFAFRDGAIGGTTPPPPPPPPTPVPEPASLLLLLAGLAALRLSLLRRA
jgi:PEP-CTERM putative exosortase interaction domain